MSFAEVIVSPRAAPTPTSATVELRSLLDRPDRPIIETVERLMSWPVRTVIKEIFESGNGAVWERWNCDKWVRLDSCAYVPGMTPFLPAMVLYTPPEV